VAKTERSQDRCLTGGSEVGRKPGTGHTSKIHSGWKIPVLEAHAATEGRKRV
jgi:hypothetical protein